MLGNDESYLKYTESGTVGAQDFRWRWKLISIDFRQKKRKTAYIMCSEVTSKICGRWRSQIMTCAKDCLNLHWGSDDPWCMS